MHSLMVPEENIESQKNKAEALVERLINQYGDDVLRISYIYLKDSYRAEDAFQEVFFKVYKKYGSFNKRSSEKTWIVSITINVCKDMLRSSWIKRVLLHENLETDNKTYEIEGSLVRMYENKLLLKEVMDLPAVYKDVVLLHYYQGYDTVEIGRILKSGESTIRSRLFRAREMLRKKIDGRIEYHD